MNVKKLSWKRKSKIILVNRICILLEFRIGTVFAKIRLSEWVKRKVQNRAEVEGYVQDNKSMTKPAETSAGTTLNWTPPFNKVRFTEVTSPSRFSEPGCKMSVRNRNQNWMSSIAGCNSGQKEFL